MIQHIEVETTRAPFVADDIFNYILLNENIWIPMKISLEFVPKGPINNIPALVHIMAWCRLGDKPLSEPMMVSLITHICVTRPQWGPKTIYLTVYCKTSESAAVFGINLRCFRITLDYLLFSVHMPYWAVNWKPQMKGEIWAAFLPEAYPLIMGNIEY